MAEALAVVGIVASIVQLVDFGARVLTRLKEYQSKFGQVPEAFRHINTELPVLLDALQQTKAAIDAGSLQDETKKALLPAIEGCAVQIKSLEDVILKALPASGNSWVRRGRKALGSLRYDAKVEKITVVVRGYIQTLTYHAAALSTLKPLADRTLSRPTPSSTVPFRRDPHFVYREILAEIDCKNQQPAFRVALVGLGGVGKSQLAVEFSYRLRERSPDTWVFWVHASSRARFEDGYQKIAERAKLPGWDQPDVDVLRLVYSWLCDEANGRWVMIIDNADDLGVFCPSDRRKDSRGDVFINAGAALQEYIPQSQNGSILITSRSRDVAFRLTGSYADIIRVYPMDQEHALALLQNKLQGSFERDDAVALAEALDYMPLAITQAAAYISQRAPRATVLRYLQDLRKGDQDRTKLLDIDIGDSRRDGTASNSIIATWQISFEHIRRKRPSATRLLSLMCLFDRQGIPELLLDGHYQDHSDASSDFEDDLNMLICFSLVEMDVDGHQFEMHRLVQFSTRKWLELQGELESWREKYVTLMDDSYPVGEHENWKECQALFPHAQAAVACRPAGISALEAWASVLFKAAWYASEVGNYSVAKEMDQAALEAREATLGTEHLDTLRSINSLGLTLQRQGKYEEAELMHQRALEGLEKAFGLEHLDTLTSMANLALTYGNQGRWKEAEELGVQVMETRKRVLGAEHPDTLNSKANLASTYINQGRWKEAEELGVLVMKTRKRVLGAEHPDTLISIANLASTYRNQGQWKEAEELDVLVMETTKRVLGVEHPSTLTSMANVASTYINQGRWKEAEELGLQVIETRK
ncbi:hypothetical protein K432DRAFT_387549, partial [Lepidopterella palustris CBS 459.81]